ncbi:hypothetical protein N1030_01330 [Desulfovibrio mangrovi]|uniref:hypothetical protein n=1 Tax=Desulfovibrio mangrovi TaxID=2976983 RepID=UPI0022477BA9|nr:hypothetical protein [Desulfovibrio mangrovi]UZP67636.1 hypothetical protein N1030_01330 [Desulfovibrio mangrovi]
MLLNVGVDVDGCINLGDRVCCDGFNADSSIRIQTHAHLDHMHNFEKSKAFQKIIMSAATYEMLLPDHPDLEFRRSQVVCCSTNGAMNNVDGVAVSLFSTGHMLGGVMPLVNYDGSFLLYSSDFSWPLPGVSLPRVDYLIVDATYGEPGKNFRFSHEEVVESFSSLIKRLSRKGNVLVVGHRGRVEYAVSVISKNYTIPIVCSKRICKTLHVYRKYLNFSGRVYEMGSVEATEVLSSGGAVVFCTSRERLDEYCVDFKDKVELSLFHGSKKECVTSNGSQHYVSFTDHADFQGTVSLIESVSPKVVIVDSSRGDKTSAAKLSEYISRTMNIKSEFMLGGKRVVV